MTSRIAVTLGWMSVACAIVLMPATASAADHAGTCQAEVDSVGPVVADRIERALERCREDASDVRELADSEFSAHAVALAGCVREARQGGFRPADRLEHDIEVCLAASIDQAGTR
ncbi:MAG: hypothetical protein ABWX76_09495 [Leifsonia flava]